jgi:hypothetical protein
VYLMLKELNQRCLAARRQKAAWERWYRKMPHNRVRRPHRIDSDGRVTGYGPAEPLPEPPLDSCFCRKTTLPSGKVAVLLQDGNVEQAYQQVRVPKATAEAVEQLLIAEQEVRRRHAAL